MSGDSSVRIGVDVGGTFTDFLMEAGPAGPLLAWKTPTTYPDPSQGVMSGIQQLIARYVNASSITEVSVGTTVALNSLLERRGARTGALATRGFRDLLEIGRESRRFLYDLHQDKLPDIVPRRWRRDIEERITWDGKVLKPLDAAGVVSEVEELVADGVDAIAICFLHSYAHPVHEIQARDIIRAKFPDLAISLSHEVSPEPREYERWLLAAMDAYVAPVMDRYVRGLEGALHRISPNAKTYITQSSGGVMSTSAIRTKPIQSAMSGPAAGVLGAIDVTAGLTYADFITMDMGGTSCDIAFVRGGKAFTSATTDLGGYRVGLRSVEIQSISAGGGSIAWVDSGGFLRVGPHSAAANPGPAAYQRGGTQATVTDAHLALGHIDTRQVLGDSIALSVEAAERAIDVHVARPLRMAVREAAAGIIRIADAAMARGLEVASVGKGNDPRALSLVAFGGAAPLHAPELARQLGIPRVVVPAHAGVLSALGTLSADEKYESFRSVLQPTRDLDSDVLQTLFEDLTEEGLRTARVSRRGQTRVVLAVDMRYVGQTSTLEISLEADSSYRPEDLERQFVELYGQVFGYTIATAASEVVAARATVQIPRRSSGPLLGHGATGMSPPREWEAYFDGAVHQCRAYTTDSLASGVDIPGPAIVTTRGSTALVLPDQSATVDAWGNLIISVGPAPA